MAARNLIIRIGLDASRYNRGMDAAKRKAQETGAEISEKLDVAAAKAQPGTTVSDRVGAMLNPNGVALIAQVTRDNLADAKRQAEDLAAAMTKLQAKGASLTTTGENSKQLVRLTEMHTQVTEAIAAYEDQVRAAAEAQREEELAAEASGSALQRLSGVLARARGYTREAAESTSWLARTGRSLINIPVSLIRKGVGAIKSMGDNAKTSNRSLGSMVRSIRNIGAVSLGLRVAGAALGRLKSIVSEYISQNEALQARVNGLKSAMGQALAPAINLVVNALSALMPYVLGVANAIGSLVSGLFGAGWTQAAAGAGKTANATKQAANAQKDLNRQLMGFDQINRLEDPSQTDTGNGLDAGSSAPTASITARTPAWMERFKSSFAELFASKEFQAANIGGKLGQVLQTGLDWVGGEAMRFDWSGAGKKLRENWNSFWSSGWVESLGRTAGIALGGIGDMITTAMGPTWEELKLSYQNQGWQGVAAYVLGMGSAAVLKLTGGLFTRLIAPLFDGISEYFSKHGNDSVAGYFKGLADKARNIGEVIKAKFVDPIVNWTKNLLGIHSPSTVFAGFAEMCVEGFTQRFGQLGTRIKNQISGLATNVKDTAAKIKGAFNFSWSLPKIRLPHLSVSWQDAGALSKFFGVKAIPHLSVQWYAKGGILDGAQIFGRMGSSLLGGGEAGREAVLPLDRNTEWMDKIADRVVSRLGTGGDVTANIYLTVDGKLLTKYVITQLRAQARAGGKTVLGGA